jgi:TIR domain
MEYNPGSAIEVFYSYAHEDEELRTHLEKHLGIMKRQGAIRDWHDREITAGKEWGGAIDEHLESAHIILLLISADFLASDFRSALTIPMWRSASTIWALC